MAGGVRPDAGYSIRINATTGVGCIPLREATLDASGRFTVALSQSPGNYGGEDARGKH